MSRAARGGEAWRDVHARIAGEPVRRLQRLVLENWLYAGGKVPGDLGSVKRFFQQGVHPCTCPPEAPVCTCGRQPTLRLITRKPLTPGVGHYHTILDGMLIDMECQPTASISMQNVAPGSHTIIAVPALNDHEEVQAGAAMLAFDYEPTNPLPEITAAATTGTPAISIVSPAPGSEVSGDFTIQVAVTDFTLSQDLFGKANVPGHGHWHANVDTTSGPMMGMMTMLGMSGTDTFRASTKGLTPGPHTFFAILIDDQHAPLMPEVVASVDLVVK